MENRITNSKVSIVGKVAAEPVLSHETYGEKFYSAYLLSMRMSGTYDVIPIIISERLMMHDLEDKVVQVDGSFRSYNKTSENGPHIILSVFVSEISAADDKPDLNSIEMDGYICKQPLHRVTPSGREIVDFVIAINRPYGKSDYIPCIAWGRNARYMSEFELGKHIKIFGRIQSREYRKRLENDEIETRTAYEVSVSSFIEVEDCRNEEEN